MQRIIITTFHILLISTCIFAQLNPFTTTKNNNWYNKDLQNDKVIGTSVDKTYELILPKLIVKDTIVVAVIDVGVDINHEDLKGKIWVNKNEIENNGIDDDGNGYIDDIHGWNFLGNKLGQNIHLENYEYTRIVREYKDDSAYNEAKKLLDFNLNRRKSDSLFFADFEVNYQKVKSLIFEKTGVQVSKYEDFKKIDPIYNQSIYYEKKWLVPRFKKGFSEEILHADKKSNLRYLNYHLNTEFNPRKIINDDVNNLEDRDYGNNDVKGPNSSHGTSVSGIIAANRNNTIGINGITSNVKIMPIRVVPNGDERDKDIALAIIYAVDNGARIINMSFGKEFSPNKTFVDEAVLYAERHNVLLIHASGNEGKDLDKLKNYPTGYLLNGRYAENWLNVGATGMRINKFLPADFSNYGKNNVDIFAPGKGIVSLDTANSYSVNSGTSLAAPVVTGISALLLSYFPQLTPKELIKILFDGSYKIKDSKVVYAPNRSSNKIIKTKFQSLSKSGGIINAYNSFLIAIERNKTYIP